MDVLEMTNTKIYELSLQILVEHLGIDGTSRFLSICKPRKNQTSAVGEQLSRSVMESIQERVYRMHAAQQSVPNNENIRSLDQLSDMTFYKLGIGTIADALGPVGMARFIRIRRPNTIDYTAERHKWLDKLDKDTILTGIQQIQQSRCAFDNRR